MCNKEGARWALEALHAIRRDAATERNLPMDAFRSFILEDIARYKAALTPALLKEIAAWREREAQSRDVLEVLEDRYDRRATVVASQLPLDRWHQWLSEPTLADAILDRLMHRSYRFVIKGPSKRKDEPTPNP